MRNRSKALLVIGCILIGFVLVSASQIRPPNPQRRMPQRYRLADLIEDQTQLVAKRRGHVATLRAQLDSLQKAATDRQGNAQLKAQIDQVSDIAGTDALRGPGLKVSLSDSSLEEAPSGNVNDLVIHSTDVQIIVNSLWEAGADGISINEQRLVSTSAVLCVGNTLLLNGTVHSPPYVISAVGADRSKFESARLVQTFSERAEKFSLGFDVSVEDDLTLPKFSGSSKLQYARPAAG